MKRLLALAALFLTAATPVQDLKMKGTVTFEPGAIFDGTGATFIHLPGGGGGGGDSLPDMTGHNGQFLQTDGFTASWQALPIYAIDILVVHRASNETIAGVKTFQNKPVVPDDSFNESKVLNLLTDLSLKVPTSRTVNTKPLSNDILLTPADVGAQPANIQFVSSGTDPFPISAGKTSIIQLVPRTANIVAGLRPANDYQGGTVVTYADAVTPNSSSFGVSFTVAGGDTLNGATESVPTCVGGGTAQFITDGISKWTQLGINLSASLFRDSVDRSKAAAPDLSGISPDTQWTIKFRDSDMGFVPPGGTAGQTLKKGGPTDFFYVWGDVSPADVLGSPAQQGVTTEVWFSIRTDGKGGLGTATDPFDGSGTNFNTKMRAYMLAGTTNLTVHLIGAGPFTQNQTTTYWYPLNGWRIIGSGMYVTTIQNQTKDDIQTPYNEGYDNIYISDLTIDANWPNVANSTTDGATVRSFAATANGDSNGLGSVRASGTGNFTALDLGRRLIATGIPANSWVGRIDSASQVTASSSATSLIPVSVSGMVSGATVTLKEKDVAVGAIYLRGSNNTLQRVRMIGGFGSNANGREMFLGILGIKEGTADCTNNQFLQCRAEDCYGNYGNPFAFFGSSNSTGTQVESRIEDCMAIGNQGIVGAGSTTPFTSGGVNFADVRNLKILNNTFIDCQSIAYTDTGDYTNIEISGNTLVRGWLGIGLYTQGGGNVGSGVRIYHNTLSMQKRVVGGANYGIVISGSSHVPNVVIDSNTVTFDDAGPGNDTFWNITTPAVSSGQVINNIFEDNWHVSIGVNGVVDGAPDPAIVVERNKLLASSATPTGMADNMYDRFGTGSPEGVVTAPIGTTYRRTNGGPGTVFYVKASGSGNTGWIADGENLSGFAADPIAVAGFDSNTWMSGLSAQHGLQFKDEGSNLGTSGTVTDVDFAGAGVTASRTGDTVTVSIGGGGGGGTNVATDAIWDAVGDLVYGSGSDTAVRLAGNASTTNKVLTQNGNGSVPSAPHWAIEGTASAYDIGTSGGSIPLLNGNNTYSGSATLTGATIIGNGSGGYLSAGSIFGLAGQLNTAVVSADQNDYNPAGLGVSSVLRIPNSVDINITGIVPTITATGAAMDGRILIVINPDTIDTITLKDQSASSSANNRFLFGRDIAIKPLCTVTLRYTTTSGLNKWRLISQSDPIIPETNVTFTDVTTGNVSTSAHGYAPKLDNNVQHFINGQGGYTYPVTDGWTPSDATWTYASSTTFTVSGDQTAIYSKGDKLKLTQTTAKYFYVVGASYSSPNTTITVTGGSDYTLANAAITLPFYSKSVSPNGFPTWLNYIPTYTGFSSAPNTASATTIQFQITGTSCTFRHYVTNTAGTSNSTSFAISLPVASSASGGSYAAWRGYDSSTFNNTTMAELPNSSGTVNLYTTWAGGVWTASGSKNAFGTITYGY